eukprot:COSAG02_NODE_2329_length_9121_cov_3.015183_4_plen_349_part_00
MWREQESDEPDDEANDGANDSGDEDNELPERGAVFSAGPGTSDEGSYEQGATNVADHTAESDQNAQEVANGAQKEEEQDVHPDGGSSIFEQPVLAEATGASAQPADDLDDGASLLKQSGETHSSPAAEPEPEPEPEPKIDAEVEVEAESSAAAAAAVGQLFSGGSPGSIFVLDADAQLWFGYFSLCNRSTTADTAARQPATGVLDAAKEDTAEQLKFLRVLLPFKVASVAAVPIDDSTSTAPLGSPGSGDLGSAVGSRSSSCSKLRLLLTDGNHGIYWATLKLTWSWSAQTTLRAAASGEEAQVDMQVEAEVSVDRCALSSHVAKGACYLTDDCAAVYGGQAISLWMH